MDKLKACGTSRHAVTVSGDQLKLPELKLNVKLADIKAPEFWPPAAAYESWPHGQKAEQAVAAFLSGKKVALFCGKHQTTPFGARLAHIMVDGVWLQEWIVKNGHAYFFPQGATKEITTKLQQAEKLARQATLGLWRVKSLQPVNIDDNRLNAGWFQLVQGKVLSANKVGKRIYLNFGPNWRTDFTVQVEGKLAKAFPFETFEEKHIEVRGWIEWSSGPKIILSHPNQIRPLAVSKPG